MVPTQATEPTPAPTEPIDDGWTGTRVVLLQPAAPAAVRIVDCALPEELARDAYDFSLSLGRAWGDYVSLSELEAADDGAAGGGSSACNDDATLHSLAARVVRAVWLAEGGAAAELLGPERHRVHGFAIWANSGCVGEECAYHLDYAELHRRRSHRLHPPLLASTVHVSPFADEEMVGGVFGVNRGGLDHYRRFGHHGVLARAEPDALERDWEEDARWVKIGYRFRRAILFDGSLPHRATATQALPPGARRVVIGINVFDTAVGPVAARAPVHSAAYREEMASIRCFRRVADGTGGAERYGMVPVDDAAAAAVAEAAVSCAWCEAVGSAKLHHDGQPFCSVRCLKAQRKARP